MRRLLGDGVRLGARNHEFITGNHEDDGGFRVVSVRQVESKVEGLVGVMRKIRRDEHIMDAHFNWSDLCGCHLARPFSPSRGASQGKPQATVRRRGLPTLHPGYTAIRSGML